MKIADVTAYPLSFPLPEGESVTLGIGRTVKRDTVVVRVETDEGHVGWGESHHGRCPGAVAHIVNATLRQLVAGLEATDVNGVWSRIYRMQLGSHGMGAACAMAMSGLDMALWDIRAKAVGWPLYRLLGGRAKGIQAYAGGISLGYQPPGDLAAEAAGYVRAGFTAVKLRIGDTVAKDLERIRAVREAVGGSVDILTDANASYTVEDARRAMPALDELAVGWLEEPFSPHDYRAYATAASFGLTPLAAGENHYTRYEFVRLVEEGSVRILQPDLSKSGGVTEVMRVAALGGSWKLPVHPHSSASGLNMAATIHFLCAIDNPGYFEADLAKHNAFREELAGKPYEVRADGTVWPLERPGIGLEVDMAFVRAHPVIEGPGYV